ncbi:MAG: MBOAT family protein [Oscillospiraceae bacterium]|nr:MBOAT family protein [Oscillospiraceae bacterium]
MVFANLIFLYIFLPLNLIFYLVWNNRTYRNIVLILFSLAFYTWGEPIWVTLLIFSATLDYINGLIIEKHKGKPLAVIALIASVVINIGILATFKYSGFFVQNLNTVLGLSLPVPSFSLPIGISFYTFQTLSYTIDVYRGKVSAQPSYIKFLMYVSMFPQLVAGPIVRYSVMENQIDTRTVSIYDLTVGFNYFCAGLAKKVLIANWAGMFVTQYLDGDLTMLSAAQAWFGIIMFAIQIYFDFSGYSDMATGLARMLGFRFERNFNYPYVAKTLTDFWRRWHISMSSFFRDYVYIPLGGNRSHWLRNIIITWFLTGLWHGASWNYILWGLYFGFFLVLEKLVYGKFFEEFAPLGHIYRSFMVTISWAIFYFCDMHRLGLFFKALFGFNPNASSNLQLLVVLANNIFWLIIAVIFSTPVTQWMYKKIRAAEPSMRFFFQSLQLGINIVLVFICTCALVGQSYNPFLYFKF